MPMPMPNLINSSVPVEGIPATVQKECQDQRKIQRRTKDKKEGALMRANPPRPVVFETRLLHCLRSLDNLWKEFHFEYSECKPAKEWNVLSMEKTD